MTDLEQASCLRFRPGTGSARLTFLLGAQHFAHRVQNGSNVFSLPIGHTSSDRVVETLVVGGQVALHAFRTSPAGIARAALHSAAEARSTTEQLLRLPHRSLVNVTAVRASQRRARRRDLRKTVFRAALPEIARDEVTLETRARRFDDDCDRRRARRLDAGRLVVKGTPGAFVDGAAPKATRTMRQGTRAFSGLNIRFSPEEEIELQPDKRGGRGNIRMSISSPDRARGGSPS